MNEVSNELTKNIDNVLEQIDEIENKTKELAGLKLGEKIDQLNQNLVLYNYMLI